MKPNTDTSNDALEAENDGLEIGIDAITEKTMTISFIRTGDTVFEGGRNKAVGGKHVMTMGR